MLRAFILLLIFSSACWTSLYSQGMVLGINDRYSDEALISDVFLKGFCNNVSNVEVTGLPYSMGNFFNGADIIGIDQGIIISTGVIDSASGPNLRTDTGGIIGTTEDEDLSRIATSGIFDVSGVSFDFVPISNRVSFTYVFASEEYCEYVDTPFNDVFGFFVSGPGIEGKFSNNGINVARIPGSQEFVSINNVNHLRNNDLYVKNELEEDADFCGISFGPTEQLGISFDGFTIPMRAEFDVIPCETYTIRLLIADVNDFIWDSAVFLEMNSFDIGGNVQVTALSETGQDTTIAEGCTDGLFRFERINTDLSNSQTYNLVITDNSTATPGMDFVDFDRSITFGPGEAVVEVPIELIEDADAEDIETLGLSIAGDCPCVGGGRAILNISDQETFEANLDGYAACAGEEFTIEPNVIGGAPPYTYRWEDGQETQSITTTINGATSLQVVVTDYCGRRTVADGVIDIQDQPIARINDVHTFCNGVNAQVPVRLEGNPPWNLSYQINTESAIEIQNIEFQPVIISAGTAGAIRLLTFSDRTCTGLVEGAARLTAEEIEIETFTTPATCGNTFDGSLSFDLLSSSPAAEIIWLPDVIEGTEGDELLAGEYRLVVRDERGCTLDETIPLGVLPDGVGCETLNIYIPNVFSPNGDNIEDDFIIHLEHEPSIVGVASFRIYDRWGNEVFTRRNFLPTDNNLQFDGTMNGKNLEPGVFSYVAIFNIIGGTTRSLTGTITLVR